MLAGRSCLAAPKVKGDGQANGSPSGAHRSGPKARSAEANVGRPFKAGFPLAEQARRVATFEAGNTRDL